MASGDNVDAIEVVETSFAGSGHPAEDPRRAENSAEEDNKSTGEKVTALDVSITLYTFICMRAYTETKFVDLLSRYNVNK